MQGYKKHLSLISRTSGYAVISRRDRYLTLQGNYEANQDGYNINKSNAVWLRHYFEDADEFVRFLTEDGYYYIEQIVKVTEETDDWEKEVGTEFITYIYYINEPDSFMDAYSDDEYCFTTEHSYDYIHKRILEPDTDVVITAAMIEVAKLIKMGSPIESIETPDGIYYTENNPEFDGEARKEIVPILNGYLETIMLNRGLYNEKDIKHIMIACNELLDPYEEVSKIQEDYNDLAIIRWSMKDGIHSQWNSN